MMAETQIHTVNLRRVRRVNPRKRAKKAMRILKDYVTRHTGAESVSVSNAVNQELWANGAKKPPTSLDIQIMVDGSTAHVELPGRDVAVTQTTTEETADLSDEDIAEMNVDEVKEHVEAGTVDAQRALDVEYAGKNRTTLIDWLEERIGGDEDEVAEEPEPESVEESAEDADEETGDAEESGEETYDLPDDVIAVFEDGTIGDGKDAAQDLGKDAFEKLLNFEEAHQNRKGMKKFLRSNMN